MSRDLITLHPTLSPSTPTPPPGPPPDRGRVFYVDDIQRLYGRYPEGHTRAGQWRVSRWWVTHRFAPDAKWRNGRVSSWWEYDALQWRARQARLRGSGEEAVA